MPNDGMPRTNRRTMLKSFSALTTAGALAGCSSKKKNAAGGGDYGSDGDSGSGSGGKKVTTASSETFKNQAGVEVGGTFEAVKELAKKEKRATIYSTVGLQEGMSSLKEGFEKRYPDVRVGIVTGGSEDLSSKWNTEYKTDNVNGSVFFSGSKIKQTWQNEQVMKLKPEYMPTFADAPDKYKDDKNHNWIAVRQLMGSMFYNTDKLAEGDVTSWMQLVEEDRWADQKLGWDPTPNLALMTWFLQKFGREFFEKLHDQRPRFVDSHTDLARFTGAGEFPVAFTYTHKMASFGEKLPVSYFPLDPMPSTIAPAVVNNKAPQPNTSLMFLNYMNTKEGQEIIANTEMISWRVPWQGYPDVYPNDNYTVEVVPPSADLQKTQQMWNEVMGDLIGS